MRRLLLLLIPVAFVGAGWLARPLVHRRDVDLTLLDPPPRALPAAVEASLPERLAQTSFLYREHGDGRVVSEVEIELVAEPEAHGRLRVRASAMAPLVSPPRGFSWIAGENPITAREMLDVVESGRARMVTTDPRTGTEHEGGLELGDLTHFTERRLMPDGTVRNVGETREPLPMNVILDSGALTEGRYHTEILVDDRPRLKIDFSFDAQGGEIENVESGHPEEEDDQS